MNGCLKKKSSLSFIEVECCVGDVSVCGDGDGGLSVDVDALSYCGDGSISEGCRSCCLCLIIVSWCNDPGKSIDVQYSIAEGTGSARWQSGFVSPLTFFFKCLNVASFCDNIYHI